MPIWFKLLLAWFIGLLILLLWLNSINQTTSPKQVAVTPADVTVEPEPPIVHKQADDRSIRQAMLPLLEEPTVILTFEDALPEPSPAYTDTKKAAISTPKKPVKYRSHQQLALLIDDVGYDLKALQRLIALPFKLTVAILPDAPHAEAAARMAHQHGVQVMLHMPMQTSNPKYQQKMERYYLHDKMTKAEFTKVLENALAKVPYVEGINNHMGSLLTSNPQYMGWLMALCLKHDLFFIDSRTASTSVAAQVAQQAGVPWNQRDIFLDHNVDQASLQHAWSAAIACLKKNQRCIMIGHPHAETLNFLEHHANHIQTQDFVSIEALLHKP